MQNRNIGVRLATSYQHSPYVGPRPFTTADRDIFFGRNQEGIELTSLIKAHPEVLLYAPSGAGKSSLLYAEVLPVLENEEDFDALPPARVRSQESATIPEEKVNNIYVFNALKDLSNDGLSVLERARLTLSDFLTKRPRPVSGEWEQRPGDQEPPERRLPRVVIFDQFEEIFTLYPERYKDRQDFFVQVAEALEADPYLRVVFSMREDYIAELDPFVEILPQGLRTRFRLERLRRNNALACVKRPLETERCKETRRHFADGAAESLVDKLMAIKVKGPSGEKVEVTGEFVDPVQLQVVCQTLWEKLPPHETSITVEDINKYANVDEALLDFYETSIRNAVGAANNIIQATLAGGANSPVPQPITEGLVRGWFEQKLITRENKRNMVNREQHMTAGLPNVVVDELENQHLIRVEMRGGEPWYELSHDRFIPPIRESNRRFLLQQPLAKRKAQELEQRAEEWWNAQRDPRLLLNRGELADAQNWMRTEAAAIGYSNTLFALVQASEAAIQHEESLQQQALADALQQKAAAERQRSRQLKIGLVIASVLFMVALASAAGAYRAEGRAKQAQEKERTQRQLTDEKNQALQIAIGREADEREKANQARKDAEKALGFANQERAAATTARQQAEAARAEAERQRAAAEKQRSAAVQQSARAVQQSARAEGATKLVAQAVREERSARWASESKYQLTMKNPELALRLAMMAFDQAETAYAQSSLRQSYQAFASQRILKGHDAIIRKAVYGPDGSFIFTASEDKTVKQWDVKTTQLVKTFAGHTGGIHDLAISPDGRFLATEAADASARIWNLADGTSIQLNDLTGPVAALAFSPDGRLLATEASDSDGEPGAVPRIWDVRTGKIVHRLIGHTKAITALAFSPDGKFLATASWDHTARIWDTTTGKEVKTLSGHTAPLVSIAFSPNGKLLVTGSYDSTARIWDLAGQKEPIILRGHTGVVQSVAFSPKGQFVLTSGRKVRSFTLNYNEVPLPPEIKTDDEALDDNSVRLFDLDGKLIRQFSGHTGDINSASFSPDGKLILTASADGTAKVWKSDTAEKILDVEPPGGAGQNYAAFSPDGAFVLAAGTDTTAQVWRVRVPARVQFDAGQGPVTTIAFPNQTRVVTSGSDGVRVWDANTGLPRHGEDHLVTESVYSAALNSDGRLLITGSRRPQTSTDRDTSGHLWVNGSVYDLGGHRNAVTHVAFSPQGNYVLTMSSEAANVWRTADRTLVRAFAAEFTEQQVGSTTARRIISFSAAAFSKDDRYVAFGNRGGRAQVFEVASGTLLSELPRNKGAINSVAFNQETVDPLIVTAGFDGTAQVCVATTGKCLHYLRDHIGPVIFAAFSPDGRRIVTIGVDGAARIWDADGSLVTAFQGYSDPPTSAALTPDGTQLAVGTNSGGIVISDCSVCKPIQEVRRLADDLKPRDLTVEETDKFGFATPR